MASLKALPYKPYNPSKSIRTHIQKAINDQLATMQKDFQRTTRTWKTSVIFVIHKTTADGNTLRGSVGTDNKIYGYVNDGTRAHIIRPKRARALRFSTGYRAKTRYRVLSSSSGGSYGAVAYAQIVHHPGTKPREFDITIADMRQSDFEKAVAQAIVRGTTT